LGAQKEIENYLNEKLDESMPPSELRKSLKEVGIDENILNKIIDKRSIEKIGLSKEEINVNLKQEHALNKPHSDYLEFGLEHFKEITVTIIFLIAWYFLSSLGTAGNFMLLLLTFSIILLLRGI